LQEVFSKGARDLVNYFSFALEKNTSKHQKNSRLFCELLLKNDNKSLWKSLLETLTKHETSTVNSLFHFLLNLAFTDDSEYSLMVEYNLFEAFKNEYVYKDSNNANSTETETKIKECRCVMAVNLELCLKIIDALYNPNIEKNNENTNSIYLHKKRKNICLAIINKDILSYCSHLFVNPPYPTNKYISSSIISNQLKTSHEIFFSFFDYIKNDLDYELSKAVVKCDGIPLLLSYDNPKFIERAAEVLKIISQKIFFDYNKCTIIKPDDYDKKKIDSSNIVKTLLQWMKEPSIKALYEKKLTLFRDIVCALANFSMHSKDNFNEYKADLFSCLSRLLNCSSQEFFEYIEKDVGIALNILVQMEDIIKNDEITKRIVWIIKENLEKEKRNETNFQLYTNIFKVIVSTPNQAQLALFIEKEKTLKMIISLIRTETYFRIGLEIVDKVQFFYYTFFFSFFYNIYFNYLRI
jgi:hypothetical protein